MKVEQDIEVSSLPVFGDLPARTGDDSPTFADKVISVAVIVWCFGWGGVTLAKVAYDLYTLW